MTFHANTVIPMFSQSVKCLLSETNRRTEHKMCRYYVVLVHSSFLIQSNYQLVKWLTVFYRYVYSVDVLGRDNPDSLVDEALTTEGNAFHCDRAKCDQIAAIFCMTCEEKLCSSHRDVSYVHIINITTAPPPIQKW